MTKAIGALPPMSAPPGWEQRVLKEIDDRAQVRSRWAFLAWAWKGALAAAAVGFAAWILLFRSSPPSGEVAMRTEVVPSAQVVRSDSAKVGDTWRVVATVGDAPAWDVRVYQDRRLVASCADGARCARDGEAATAEIRLDRPGPHRALLLVGGVLPATSGDYDEDAGAPGVRILVSSPLTVLPFAGR